MGATCSVCRSAESADFVNAMLWEKKTLNEIVTATGFHRSSIDRHKKGACIFSFSNYRSARVKNLNRPVNMENGRVIVAWPPEAPGSNGKVTFTSDGHELSPDQLTASDVLLTVQYEITALDKYKNSPALDNEATRAAAYAENVERNPEKPFIAISWLYGLRVCKICHPTRASNRATHIQNTSRENLGANLGNF